MTCSRLSVLSVAAFLSGLVLPALTASAQVPPFFNGGGGIFDPEIDVIESGQLLDAQAVVSADRKYVTMTMRPQNTQLLALREFAFQVGGGGGGAPAGIVGGGAAGAGAGFGANADAAASDSRSNATSAARRPASASSNHSLRGKPYPQPHARETSQSSSILDKPGMTLVGRVAPADDK
jgi:hypothetical protein